MGGVNPAQDAMAKIRDDPLLAIKREEMKSLNNILQNPVKMNEIRKVCQKVKRRRINNNNNNKKNKKSKKKRKRNRNNEGLRDFIIC